MTTFEEKLTILYGDQFAQTIAKQYIAAFIEAFPHFQASDIKDIDAVDSDIVFQLHNGDTIKIHAPC